MEARRRAALRTGNQEGAYDVDEIVDVEELITENKELRGRIEILECYALRMLSLTAGMKKGAR
jgi:hypothetical protein